MSISKASNTVFNKTRLLAFNKPIHQENKVSIFHAFNISSYHSCNTYLINSLYHFPDK